MALLLPVSLVVVSAGVVATNCSYDSEYQTKDLTFQIGDSIISVRLEMWAHHTQVRFQCVDYYHYMKLYNFGPSYFTVNLVNCCEAVADWNVALPSWNLISSWGSFSQVNSCGQYFGHIIGAGGNGYNYATFEGQIYWPPCGSGTASLTGFVTNIWHSNQYGQSYAVTNKLTDMTNGVPGQSNTQVTYMTS